MGEKILIDGVELILSDPDDANLEWIGGEIYMTQLKAAWLLVDEKDIPLNPQILGAPGIGKTTLAYTAAKEMGRPVYIFQCTVDTRPEDLLISPVIGENNTIKYHASSLVSAMIKGGICILDEANRMAEKSWASLAPLLDQRRYIESIIAGIKVQAHPDFRVCVTMNDDSSTFEIPEYIHSRLQPQIFVEFPDREEEIRIIQFNLPFAKSDLIKYTVDFLQRAHKAEKPYSVRDGINICRYYLKMSHYSKKNGSPPTFPSSSTKPGSNELDEALFRQAMKHILGEDAINFFINKRSPKDRFSSLFGDGGPNSHIKFTHDPYAKRVSNKDSDDKWEMDDSFDEDDDEDMDMVNPDDEVEDENHFGDDEFESDWDDMEDTPPEFRKSASHKADEDIMHFVDKKGPKRPDEPPPPESPKGPSEPPDEFKQNVNDMIDEFLNRRQKKPKSR
jgi:hypothetical protein